MLKPWPFYFSAFVSARAASELSPADSDQQPVAAGHIGDGVVHILRVMGGGYGEVKVYGILGKDCYQSQEYHGERLRNLSLSGLEAQARREAAPSMARPLNNCFPNVRYLGMRYF